MESRRLLIREVGRDVTRPDQPGDEGVSDDGVWLCVESNFWIAGRAELAENPATGQTSPRWNHLLPANRHQSLKMSHSDDL
jgi:hypothetical protein